MTSAPRGDGNGRAGGWDQDSALARAVLSQQSIAVMELDMDLRPVRTNGAYAAMRPGGAGDDWLLEVTGTGAHGTVRAFMARVAETGTPVVAAEYPLGPEGSDRMVSSPASASPTLGAPVGIAIAAVEVTERHRAQRRLSAAYREAFEIGGSLDVVHSARDLAAVLVPALGDLAFVDFPDDVLQGRDPTPGYHGAEAFAARRVATKSADGEWPAGLVRVGELVPTLPNR
ncbi:PAS domain-containing protein [Streptomyces zhihengii]